MRKEQCCKFLDGIRIINNARQRRLNTMPLLLMYSPRSPLIKLLFDMKMKVKGDMRQKVRLRSILLPNIASGGKGDSLRKIVQ